MLGPEGDGAPSLQDARKYAGEAHGIPMITGNDILGIDGYGVKAKT